MTLKFTMMTDCQMQWFKRAFQKMVELTACFGTMERPFKDADYEQIIVRFSDYTEKARKNQLIICGAAAFIEYLDGLDKKQTEYQKLDQKQMQKIGKLVDEFFDLTIENQNTLYSEDQMQAVEKKMNSSCKQMDNHMLALKLAEVFTNYLSDCMTLYAEPCNENDKLQMENQDICRKRAKSR